MNKRLIVSLASAPLLWAITPAAAYAMPYCSSGPGLNLTDSLQSSYGCLSGSARNYAGGGDGLYSNAGGGDPLAAVLAAITSATGTAPVDLALYGKSDFDAGSWTNGSLFALTAAPGGLSGTWDVLDPSVSIKYITVKAANSFTLYELPGLGANSGTWSTAGILTPGPNGNQPGVSHISFWTAASAVPEPASWAMMIGGLALVGGSLRRRSIAFRPQTA